MTNLVELIKKIAINAVKESDPCNVVFGTVTSASPLKIQVEQKLVLTKEFLIQTDYVKENGLKYGDKVILLRMQGGQRYIVLSTME